MIGNKALQMKDDSTWLHLRDRCNPMQVVYTYIHMPSFFLSVFQCFRSGTHVSFLNSNVLLQSSLAKETTVFSLSFLGCPRYLVNGLFRPHISRLDRSPK